MSIGILTEGCENINTEQSVPAYVRILSTVIFVCLFFTYHTWGIPVLLIVGLSVTAITVTALLALAFSYVSAVSSELAPLVSSKVASVVTSSVTSAGAITFFFVFVGSFAYPSEGVTATAFALAGMLTVGVAVTSAITAGRYWRWFSFLQVCVIVAFIVTWNIAP